MKLSAIGTILSLLVIFTIISSVFLKKRKRFSKTTKHLNNILAKFESMIDPSVVENKWVKNLLSKDLHPETNPNHRNLLTKSIIGGVLNILNVPEDKITAKLDKVTNEELIKMMRVLINFCKKNMDVENLKKLGEFNIEGLNVNDISPGLGRAALMFLQKYIIIQP